MSIFSSIQRQNKNASGAPFAAGSAANGLSVDTVTGKIVLGQSVGEAGNPAILLGNREIPLGTFDFAIGIATNRRLLIDQVGAYGLDWFGDVDGASAFGFAVHVDNNNGIINLGDYNGTFTGMSFFMDDSGRTFQMFDNRGSYFLIGNSAGGQFPADYQFGDIDNVNNGTGIKINDRAGITRIFTTGMPQLIGTNGVAYTNNAGAAVGTLNNAPAAGNPTKWIPINDNGTIRNIPAW